MNCGSEIERSGDRLLTMTLTVESKVFPDLPLPSVPRLACCAGSLFAFVHRDDSIHLFDSATLSVSVIPSAADSITRVALSPSRSHVFAGLEDGGVCLFDVAALGLVESVPGAMPRSIAHCAFVGDCDVLCVDEAFGLSSFSVANSLSQTPLTTFANIVTDLIVADQNYVIVSTIDKLTVAELGPKFSVVIEHPGDNPIGAVCLPFVAVASAAQLTIYKLGEGRVREAAMTWVPKFAHFLSSQTVAVVQSDHTIWLCDVGERSPSISRNEARGTFVRGSGAIHVVGETSRCVTTLSCIDFDERVEQLKRSGDVKGALELCRSVVKRTISVETAASSLLEEVVRADIADTSFVVGFCKETGMETWAVQTGMEIFAGRGRAKAFVTELAKADPTAKIFPYDEQFVRRILEICADVDIGDFLCALPRQLLSLEVLLDWAVRVGNLRVAARVHVEMGDTVGGANICYSVGDFSGAFALLKQKLTVKSLLWLFAIKDSQFPRLVNLIRTDPEFAVDVAQKATAVIAVEPLVMALLTAIDAAGLPPDTPLFKIVEGLILKANTIKFTSTAMGYLLNAIFNQNVGRSDNRQRLFEKISVGAGAQFRRSLKPLVDKFGLGSTDRLSEMMERKEGDPFSWIDKNLAAATRAAIAASLRAFADRFAALDFEKFIQLIDQEFPELVTGIVDEFKDDEIKNYYIYRKLTEGIEAFGPYLPAVAGFIAKHFPDELPGLFDKFGGTDRRLFDAFRAGGLFECCLTFLERTGEVEKSKEFVKKLIVKGSEKVDRFVTELFRIESSELFKELVGCYVQAIAKKETAATWKGFSHMIDCALKTLDFDYILNYCRAAFAPLGAAAIETVTDRILKGRTFDADGAARLHRRVRSFVDGDDVEFIICAVCRKGIFTGGDGFNVLTCGHAVHRGCAAERCPACLARDSQ
jgi:hypothetical protein